MTLAALLRECVENPDDDAPRLVLADWLDDHGDAERAEFVRLQLAIAELEYDDPRRPPLRARTEELLKRNAKRWLGRARKWCTVWDRGLPSAVIDRAGLAKTDQFAEAWDWCSEVRVNVTAKELPGLRDCPLLHRLSVVEIAGCDLMTAGGRAVAESPWLRNVRILSLQTNDIGNRGVAALADSPFVTNLRSLDLRGNRLGPSAAEAIAASPRLSNLESLDLSENAVQFAGLAALLTSPHLTRLRTLEMNHNYPLGTRKGAGLPPCPRPPSLTSLDLMCCGLGPRGAAALAGCDALAKLTRLNLAVNSIVAEGARALADSPHLANLTALDLEECSSGDEGVFALTRSPHLTRLEELRVGTFASPWRSLTRAGVEALAAWPGLARLHTLSLNADAAGAAALARSPFAAGLRSLTFLNGNVGDEGAAALAASPHLEGPRRLTLGDNKISETGVASLRARFGERVRL